MIDCLFMAPGGHGLADSRLYWQPAQGAGRWLDLPALGAELLLRYQQAERPG